MSAAPLPSREAQRLDALRQYEVLDTPPDAAFDDITRLAAQALQAPISLISLIDETRQWFKSHFGLDSTHTGREVSFCAHAILHPDDVFEVPDASADPRFADNPLVTGEPHIRFYAGVSLTVPGGHALGTLNVIDRVPRRLSADERNLLRTLGRQVVAQFELRRRALELKAEAEERIRSESRLRGQYEHVIEQLQHSDREKTALLEEAQNARLALTSALESEQRTRSALVEAQQFSARLTEVMPSVLYVYDFVERRNVFVNREVLASLGHDVVEMMKDADDPVLRFMHPEDQALFGDHMARVMGLRDGQIADLMYRMRHADGSWRWFQSRDTVMAREPDGTVRRIVGTATDITATKHAEQALVASEQRFRALWETAPDAVIVLDETGRINYANPSTARVFGWNPDQLVGQDIAVLQSASLRAAHRSGVARYLATGKRRVNWAATEAIGLHRLGHEFAIEVSFSHIDLGGQHVFAGFLRNIEARKRAEAERARLADFLDKSLNEVYVFDPVTLRFDYANEAGRTNLGRSLDELRGMTPRQVTLAPDGSSFDVLLRPLLSGEQPVVTFKTEHLRTNGTRYPVLVNAQFVGSGAEQVVLATALDVTAQEAAEAARSQLLSELRQSQKMEALGTLAGGIAHDFNNVVGAILGNVVLARQDLSADHPAAQSIGQINKAALRARDLVSQILSFSRRQETKLVDQALGPIIADTVQLMRSTLPASVALRVNIGSEPIAARADGSQIGQVLMNLCTNAWHASAGAAPCIEIGLDRRVVVRDEHNSTDGLPSGDYAHLWVTDDGKGMDAATRERMFEPFFTTKPVGQGTGLGLSVVHGIVMAHQGAITVDSELGRGTTVHVLLPLRQPLPQQSGPSREVTETAVGSGQHVLCVDDDEVMLLMVERLLQRAGYRVTALQDAELALAALRERPQDFDVVLSDFNMPGMTGLQLALHVGKLRADLPVALISGDISDELRVEAAAAGVAALVPKQNAFNQLAGIIHRLCAAVGELGTLPVRRADEHPACRILVAADESRRLKGLHDLFVLDTEPEPIFDAIAKLASSLCGVPIALLSLVDEERQWIKANVGLPGVKQAPRNGSFCDHAIDGGALFEVPDATTDIRFADHPLVTDAPGIRFYAGAPLILPGGERIGTLCVIDRQMRHLSSTQTKGLRSLATIATQALLMRRDLMRRVLATRTQESRMQENLASRLGPGTVY